MKSRFGKIALFAGIGLVLVVLVAGVAYVVAARVATPPARAGEGREPSPAQTAKFSYEAGEIITNLADEGNRRYIKVVLRFDLADEKTQKEMEKRAYQVRHEIIAVLRSKTLAEVSGKEGMESLGRDILAAVNGLLGTDKVVNVYFSEFIIP